MKIIPERETIAGAGFYYINLIAFICMSVTCWINPVELNIEITAGLFALLLIQDIIWYYRCKLSPQDKRLIEKISTLFNSNEELRQIFKEVDFTCYAFSEEGLEPLQTICNKWDGVDYQFENSTYQKILNSLQNKISDLLNIIDSNAQYTNPNVLYIYQKAGSDDQNTDESHNRPAKRANQLTREIFQMHQKFRKIYIYKMRYN